MNPAFLPTRHDPWLALCAFLIACLAAYVALDLARRVRTPDRSEALFWLLGGSVVMGSGIWAMHFVAMLGFDAGMPLGYAPRPTALSWLAAVAAAAVALRTAASAQPRPGVLALGVLSMTAAICAMHYIGMAALDLAPGIVWHRGWVAASVLVALLASAATMAIVQAMRPLHGRRRRRVQAGAALVMGVAISAVHYLGMLAAELPVGVVWRSLDGLAGGGLGLVVGGATALLLAATLLTSAHDARLQKRELGLVRSLQASNEQLQSANAQLQRRAFEDPVTGLPNRALFDDRLAHAVARLAPQPGGVQPPSDTLDTRRLAVLFIDLDGFRPLNDSFGHCAGDQLLRDVAACLRQVAGSTHTLARIGGDEFVLLLEALDSVASGLRVADRVVAAVQQQAFSVHGREVALSCSVGLAVYPDHGDGERLLSCADAAMVAAKRGGGNACALYEPAMAGDASAQVLLAQDLRHAAERGELSLHYQPKVGAACGRLQGVEALLRWQHPERGMVSPAVFIPVAERFGLIGAIGNWVIDEACAQQGRWARAGHGFDMAINLSPHQLRQPGLVERIAQALQRNGLQARQLVCELTESSMIENVQADRQVLDQLVALGVCLSIDDFGTGYSSLAYLRRLPVRQLKIDRSLVSDVDRDPAARAVLDAIVRLAHALQLGVVAEGVETVAQQQQLVALGCDLLQGYLLARPMPADALLRWLARQQPVQARPHRPEVVAALA
ncbi:MAG: EAL domain-containing protein [Pseudomonadota bacterium]